MVVGGIIRYDEISTKSLYLAKTVDFSLQARFAQVGLVRPRSIKSLNDSHHMHTINGHRILLDN